MTSNQLFSQQTGHKYTFQLQLKKLFISPSLPFQVKIVWARGQNRIQSQNPIKLQPPQNQITLQQCFCNKSTVLFSPKRLQFRKKQSRIQVILYANGSPKQGGEFVLNLCEILDPYNIKKQQEKTYRVVTRQQKPRCEIQFKLTAEYCQEMLRDQQRSIGSGVGSISSKNTTSMAHGMSGLQGLQDQAPSKDNQSVASYNSYSTNMMRYQSGAKKQRQDSTRKEEYGLATTTRNDMFSKTTSVNMKSISGEFDSRSKGGYNRVTQQQPKQQYDNRTENFDNPSSKQLQQEQSKRSKLQAQVSRMNIYMKEQTSRLTEYIQENTKLKEQLNRMSSQQQNTKSQSFIEKQTQSMKQQYDQQLNKLRQQLGKMKQDNDDLQNRAFQLNNENRELHRRLDLVLEEREKIDEEVRRIRVEKQRAEMRFQSLSKNMEGIINTKEISTKEAENLKDQLEHIKSLNITLRESLDKQRRKTEQLQYTTNYQQSSLQQNYKKKQQHLYQLQRENTQLMTQLNNKQKELQAKKDLLYRLQKTSSQYKDKILASESQKSKFLLDNASLKNQTERIRLELSQLRDSVTKVRDEKTAEYQQRNTQLETLNYQSQQRVRSLEYEVEQGKKNYSQLITLNDAIKKQLQDKKTEIYRLQANLKSLRQTQTKYYTIQKTLNEQQRQLTTAKQQNNKLLSNLCQLQEQFKKNNTQLQQAKQRQLSMPNVDVNEILRESVQMQVELKFKTDELLRLKGIEERFNQLVYRLQMEQKNRKQVEEQTERLEKQVKDKNKLYLIEVEKGKLIINEKTQLQHITNELKGELKRCQQIIFNGDRQVKDMQQHIAFLENQNRTITSKLTSQENELSVLRQKLSQLQKLEQRIGELEKQCNEKLTTMNLLTNNLSNAQKRIHQLQYFSRNKQSQIQQAIRTAQSASQKLIEMQDTKSTISNELHKQQTEKKSLQLKCETIMQQLHSLKKQYEQEKVRSTSVVSIRSSEDQIKIRQMQNQLEKKDKLISKLTKEKLQIEEENINLHVQVMKKLSQMEKNKDIATDSGITPK